MRAFQELISPDIVEVLRREHEQIRELCADVRAAGRSRQRHSLAALQKAVHLHELGELAVAHPAARGSGPDGDAIARACQAEGGRLERSLTELSRLGVEHPGFDLSFAALSSELLDHAAREEKDEFPLLRRYLPAQRLHMMAGAMQDIRLMAGG
jgi:hypothetical protein